MKSTLTISVLLFSFFVFSQNNYVNINWNVNHSNPSSDVRSTSSLDPNGNLVTLTNKSNQGNYDISLSCMHPNGVLAWENFCFSSQNGVDSPVDMMIDLQGNIMICGNVFNGSNYDILIAKYSQTGNLLWETTFDNLNGTNDFANSLSISDNGNIIISGKSSMPSGDDALILSLNHLSGAIEWQDTRDHQGFNDEAIKAVFSNGLIFLFVNSIHNSGIGKIDCYKYDNLGVLQNVNSVTSLSMNPNKLIELDEYGSFIYLLFDIDQGLNDSKVQIKKYSTSGNLSLEWQQIINNSTDLDKSIDIEVNPNGDVFVMSKDFRNPSYGTLINHFDVNGQLVNQIDLINTNGESLIGQQIKGSINKFDVASIYESPSGDYVSYISQFDNSGQFQWERQITDFSSYEQKVDALNSLNDKIYVTSVLENTSGQTLSSISVSEKTKPILPFFQNGISVYNSNELIIKFDPAALNHTIIDKIEIESGILQDFLLPLKLEELNQYTGVEWDKFPVFKIFKRMTVGDSVSTTRLGDQIKVPEFWSTLSVIIPSTLNDTAIIDTLVGLKPLVYYVDRNYIGGLSSVPNDTYYVNQSGFAPNPMYGIDVERAWDLNVGSSDIIIGIYDSGINWDHEDYGDGTPSGTVVTGGWDYRINSNIYGNTQHDDHGHGTRVSCIAAAQRNNGFGVAGIAGGDIQNGITGCQLHSMAIADIDALYLTEAISAIVEGSLSSPNFGFGQHIQNHSWKIHYYSNALEDAVETAFRNNSIFVTASGNYYSDADAPACNSGDCEVYPPEFDDKMVLRVGASDFQGDKASISVWGVSQNVDAIAPGVANMYVHLSSINNTGLSTSVSGTSYAAPHVSGIAGLMLSQHSTSNGYSNSLSTEDVEYFIENFATDVFTPGFDEGTGYGRVDAGEILERISSPYYVDHELGGNGVVTNNVTQTLVLVENYNGLSAGSYYGCTRFDLTETIVKLYPNGHQVLDIWPRYSSSIGTSPANPTDLSQHINFVPNISQNAVSITATTHCWFIPSNLQGQAINQYVPSHPNDLKTAFSIYVMDNNVLGTEENEIVNSMNVYPNPSNDFVRLEFIGGSVSKNKIVLYDVNGKIVLKHEFQSKSGLNKVNIDISLLARGVYQIVLGEGANQITKRVVKN